MCRPSTSLEGKASVRQRRRWVKERGDGDRHWRSPRTSNYVYEIVIGGLEVVGERQNTEFSSFDFPI